MIWLILLPGPSTLSASAERGDGSFPLPPHRTVHDVLRNGRKIGEVHSQLSRDERGIWFFETETIATSRMARLLGLSAEESAHFVWRNGQIMALTYRQISRAPLRTRYWQHENDWTNGVSAVQTHEGESSLPLEDNLLDPLTLRMQLSALMHDPDKRGRDHAFRVLERDEIEDQSIFFRGPETISTSLGCFYTVRVRRFRREGSGRNYQAWLAEDLYWLPLRIELNRDNDESIVLDLTEIHPATADSSLTDTACH